MPTTYAHYRFGKDVLSVLDKSKRDICLEYIDQFNFGIYGPDVFYSYKPWSSNDVYRLAKYYHHDSFKNFLISSAKVIRKEEDAKPFLAFMYGFICHFALDVYCHGYVNQMRQDRNMRHALVEAEFDRMLMVKDNLDPFRYKPTKHMKPNRLTAVIYSKLFPEIDEAIAMRAMRSMKLFCNIIASNNCIVRALIFAVLKLTGNYEAKNGMIIRRSVTKDSDIVNEDLYRMYTKAITLALLLIEDYDYHVYDNKPFMGVTDRTFTGSRSIEYKLDEEIKEIKEIREIKEIKDARTIC